MRAQTALPRLSRGLFRMESDWKDRNLLRDQWWKMLGGRRLKREKKMKTEMPASVSSTSLSRAHRELRRADRRWKRDRYLDVCLAEYEALTTRSTYWIVIQASLWPIAVLFLGLTASAWVNLNHALLVWSGALVVQLVAASWYYGGLEVYNCVRYIEAHLRPHIEELVGREDFFEWERYLAAQRGNRPLWFEEMTVGRGCAIGLLLVAWLRWPLDPGDRYGLSLNLAFYPLVASAMLRHVRTRQMFFTPTRVSWIVSEHAGG